MDKEGSYKVTVVTRKKKWLSYNSTEFIFLSYKIYICSISDREENMTERKHIKLSKLCACAEVGHRKQILSLEQVCAFPPYYCFHAYS